ALIIVGDTPKSQKLFEQALFQPDAIERVQTTALKGLEGYGYPALTTLLDFAKKSSKNNRAEVISENLFDTLELTILNVLEGAYYWTSSGRKQSSASQKGKDAGASHDNTPVLEAMEKCIGYWDGLAAESMDSYTSEDLLKSLFNVLDVSVNTVEMKSVEEKVLTLLKRTHGIQLVEPLVAYLENPKAHFPKLAAEVIGKSWDEGHRLLMYEKAASPLAELQRAAAIGINGIAKESDIPQLIKLLASNRNLEVQKILGDTLKPLASSKSVFSLLSDVLTGEASLREKAFAAQYMSHHGVKALEPLFKALEVRELASSTATPSAEALELMKMVETSVTAIVGKDKESLPILYDRSLSKNNAAVRVSAMALAHQADQWAKLKSDKKSLVYDSHEAEMAMLRLYAQHANPILKEAGQKALKIHVDEKVKKLESLGIRGSYEKEGNFEMLEDLSENGLDPEVKQAALEAYNKLVERSERPRNRRRRY
ncbi:MAG: hypothetical protein K2X66_14015, partial [Cyanobacteria bacterium]|nr:hypothetical protein [Cyanobacteriota bacterium]